MTGPEELWRDALANGRFLLQRTDDGQAVFPPRAVAPGSGGPMEWIEASGRGTIYSVSWIYPRPPAPPYHVALITLDEGARLMSRVLDATPEALAIGQRVKAFIGESDGAPLLLFRREQEE